MTVSHFENLTGETGYNEPKIDEDFIPITPLLLSLKKVITFCTQKTIFYFCMLTNFVISIYWQ